MATKILIAGYHGFGNCGDEAILLAMKNNIKELYKDVLLNVLSFSPKDTENVYGIESVNRFKPLQVVKAIKDTDILISGGGSLLQDETSTRSLLYYLMIIFVAKLFGKKVMLYSNGIGPVSKGVSKCLIKFVINKVDLITLREQSSHDELKKLGVKKPPIFVTADPAFTLKGIDKQEGIDILTQQSIPCDKPLCGISIRPWKHSDDFIDKIAQICDYIVNKHNTNILFIPMQRNIDVKISKAVNERMKYASYILESHGGSNEILGIVGLLDILISMRLHTLIFAGVQNVPMLGLVYDPKVKSYLNLLNMPDCGDIARLELDTVKKHIDDLFENNVAYRLELKKKTDVLKGKAKQNDELLKQLI